MEYQYFEADGPAESVNDIWMCIRGVRAPSIQEAEQFLAADTAKYGGHELCIGVYCASRDETVYYDSYCRDQEPSDG